jgi:hypothetical protein
MEDMVKPSPMLEMLAKRLCNDLDQSRVAIVENFRSPLINGRLERSPELSHALEHHFLSPRNAGHCADAIDHGSFSNMRDDLDRLRLGVSNREVCVAIIAYFLKYRYLDLSSFNSKEASRPNCRNTELPAGHDQFREPIGNALARDVWRRLTSAPWLGAIEPDACRYAVYWLTELGLLEFALDTSIAAASLAPAGVATLRIRPEQQPLDLNLRHELSDAIRAAIEAENRRKGLVTDVGIGIGAVGAYETYQLIERASANDTVRIGTYHLRTVQANQDLREWLEQKPNLKFDILCLGPTVHDALTEGADETSLITSLKHGIQAFNELYDKLDRRRGQIQIRIYGEVENEAYFRGAMLCKAAGKGGQLPIEIVASVWPFGISRANYGEVLKLEGDSNMSRLIAAYYQRAWDNAIPISKSGKIEWTGWILHSLSVEVMAAIVVAILYVGLVLTVPSWRENALFGLIAAVPVATAVCARVTNRILIAIRLRRAMGRVSTKQDEVAR